MIPGLLHQRLGGAPATGVIPSPAYEYVLAHQYGLYSAESIGVFTVNPDGSWGSTGTNYPNRSGSWHNPIEVGAGSDVQVRVTLTKDLTPDYLGRPIVDGVIVNEAAGWVSASTARDVSVKVARYTQAVVVAKYIAKVEFRDSTTLAILSTGTFNFGIAVQVDQNGPPSGGGAGSGGDGQIP